MGMAPMAASPGKPGPFLSLVEIDGAELLLFGCAHFTGCVKL